ncbi:MAG: DUF4349 domain-containing protein, partial [Anaerolineae bacterium]|nr:DUF4349 domain-containing protein [Anaerolineae bacterium]
QPVVPCRCCSAIPRHHWTGYPLRKPQYLDRSAELATVNLSLTERGPEAIGTPGWQPLQTARRALNALVQTLKLGVEAVIWFALFVLPLLAVPALVLWVVWRLTRRRRAQS